MDTRGDLFTRHNYSLFLRHARRPIIMGDFEPTREAGASWLADLLESERAKVLAENGIDPVLAALASIRDLPRGDPQGDLMLHLYCWPDSRFLQGAVAWAVEEKGYAPLDKVVNALATAVAGFHRLHADRPLSFVFSRVTQLYGAATLFIQTVEAMASGD